MSYDILATVLLGALVRGDRNAVRNALHDMRPADLADFLESIPEEAWSLLSVLPSEERATAFGYLNPNFQLELAHALSRADLTDLFLHMDADERADLFQQLSVEEQETLLPGLAQAEREDIRRLASYEEGTAGAVMTSEYATLRPEQTARQALETLRLEAPDKETIYQAYVIDRERRVLGTVSLRDLILARPDCSIADLMVSNVVSARVHDPQEEVARLIARHDLLALPILDAQDRLVGIVTYDDAMDVAEEEATEDFHKGATVGKMLVSMKDATVGTLYRKRVFWLVLLVFGNIFSGAGIAYFEDTIAAYVALVFFLPLLIDSGGNAGSQSATLMVRALATGEVVMRDWASMLGREVAVAVTLGLTMALAVSLLGLFRGGPDIALVVALSMVVIVVVGSLIGMSLPFLLSRMRLDPASASAPLITSIADISGVLIYFALATWLLNLPLPG